MAGGLWTRTNATMNEPIDDELVNPCTNSAGNEPAIHIWIDADACPVSIRQILYKTGKRLGLPITLVANSEMRIPPSKLIDLIVVPHGADVADQKIVELMSPGDLVLTADIPLAAAVVKKGGIAIGSRGELFDENSVHGRLASRNLLDQLRSSGVQTGGPKPLSQKDIQTFANALDRTLTRLLKKT